MNVRIVLFCFAFLIASCSHKKTSAPPLDNFYFTGQVTDSNGAPVPNASVFVQATVVTAWVDPRKDLGTATTDQDGRYKITPLKTDIFTGADPLRCDYTITATYGPLYAVEDFNNDTVKAKASPSFVVNLRF